jgi:uncharacterized protein with GYD domain
MPSYVSLFRLTQKGIEHIRKGPDRLETAKRTFRSAGAELKHFYFVLGNYDAIVISEAPNDETVAKALLALTAAGYVRSETLRAFDEKEYRQLIAGMPDGPARIT